MFVRLKTSKKSKHPTVQIVESYRTREGKVRQEVRASLGVVRNEEDKQALVHLAYNLIQKFSEEDTGQLSFPNLEICPKPKNKTSTPATLIDYRNLTHVRDYQTGFEDVFGKISEDIGFDKILASLDQEGKHSFSALEIIKNLVIHRLQEPESKRASFLRDLFDKGESRFGLHQIYRAMDLLESASDELQSCTFEAAKTLFPEVKSYFYDATTLFYESITTDELKNFGFSKDGKFNQVQIIICLLVTNEGLPIGYEIFSGNTGESKTLKVAIENLSKRYQVKNHTVVCDRGMLSQENLNSIQDKETGMYYIVGEKLRKLPKDFQSEIFESSGYEYFGDTRVKMIEHPTRKNSQLILAYSDDRAKKDKSDRERLLKKLRKKFEKSSSKTPKDFVNNHGVKKYISFSGGQAELNSEVILKEEQWDGYFGIVTNNPELKKEEVLSQYRGLWQVEANFRVFKNDLSARPIYHWTEKRIKAHVLICFMALVLERHLYVRLRKNKTPFSSVNIHNALRLCKKIELQDVKTFRLFQLSTNKPIEAKQIYEVVGLNWRSQTVELPNPKKNVVPSIKIS